MKDFFTLNGGTPFVIFGPIHIIMTIIVITFGMLIFKYRDKLKQFKYKQNIRYIAAIVMFMNMAVYYISKIILKTFDWKIDLPLHFCFVTGFLFMYILIAGNRKLYSIVYFFTFVGPIPAIIWPDLARSFDRYIFWQFTISHHFMLLTSIYVLAVLEYKICRKDILKAFIAGNMIVGIMAIFNLVFKTNYIMMSELPDQIYRIYPFVKYMTPIFWLELVSLGAIAVAYLPAYLLNKKENLNEKVKEEKNILEDNEFKYV